VALSVGPVQRLVVLRSVVTYVGLREKRFVLSDGYSSIIVAHRLRGALDWLALTDAYVISELAMRRTFVQPVAPGAPEQEIPTTTRSKTTSSCDAR
jgi:hypothetical protein